MHVSGNFNMNNGSIFENSAKLNGGGALVAGNINMNGGNISKNTASKGGGCYLSEGSISMNGGNINENTADNGGGIYLASSSRLYTRNEAISYVTNNKANNNGGGIYITTGSTINPIPQEGTCHITNNTAKDNGGGIYTENITNYSNVNTNNNTIFSKNLASIVYRPPNDATTLYPNIGFASTSITNHPLNNYDINYINEVLAFNVSYNANGGTGSYIGPDITPGNTDTILSPDNTKISREGYAFISWNTKADGSGTRYNSEDSVTLNDDITLYAQWKSNQYTVIFEGNGGSPVDSQIVSGGSPATRPNNPTRAGYTFEGWYTDNETFKNEWDFNTIITENMTLHAKWMREQCIVTFESNGGSPVEQKRVTFDERVTKPEDPIKQGYVFSGWYTDNGTFENEWDFNTAVTEGTNLYAKWKVNPMSIFIWIPASIILVMATIFYIRINKIMKCKCKCKKCNK